MGFLMQDITLGSQVQLPLLSLLGAIGILLASLIVSWRLVFQVRRFQRALNLVDGQVKTLIAQGSDIIDEKRLSELAGIFEDEPVFSDTWAKYRRSLLIDGSCWYETPIIYGTQPVGDVFTEEALFCRVNLPFYQSFAAMLTGAGLLMTFLAFFIGLSRIQILEGAISGLPGLINGLSGKFVTSIVGLACASVFIAFEKALFHRLRTTYHIMVDRLDQVFPYRGSSAWLLEMSQHHGEQTRLLKYLSLDLGQQFRKSLTDTMAVPLLELGNTVRRMKTGVAAPAPNIAPELSQPALGQINLRSSVIKEDGVPDSLIGIFERLEASALRQEQLMARLADVLVPWTEIFPKGRLATGTLRRPSPSKPTPLTSVGHSA
jgi:hypothetical protein